MTELDFDWTDAGDAEEHACKLEAISENAGNRGRYQESTELHVAAQCIRYLDAKVEMLERENDAAEAEIDRLTKLTSRLDAQHVDMKAEIEALREAVKRELQCAFMDNYGHMNPCRGWDDRLEQALAAHDKEKK